MSRTTAEKITMLQDLEAPALREIWTRTFGRPVPKRMSRDLLLRSLAYWIQEQDEGGLGKATLRRLAGLADPGRNDSRTRRRAAPRPRPGTRLIREWRGEVHHVTVLDDGFDYRGAHYASLSQIAREITSTRWSGPLFFGLRKPGSRPEDSPDVR